MRVFSKFIWGKHGIAQSHKNEVVNESIIVREDGKFHSKNIHDFQNSNLNNTVFQCQPPNIFWFRIANIIPHSSGTLLSRKQGDSRTYFGGLKG